MIYTIIVEENEYYGYAVVVSMGRMYRPVEIKANGLREIAVALLDTGSDETVISERLAGKIKAKLYGELEGVNAQ